VTTKKTERTNEKRFARKRLGAESSSLGLAKEDAKQALIKKAPKRKKIGKLSRN
jgi:hypothetical protein